MHKSIVGMINYVFTTVHRNLLLLVIMTLATEQIVQCVHCTVTNLWHGNYPVSSISNNNC